MKRNDFLMIRAVIMDDEELSIQLLKKKLQAFPIIQVVKTYSTQEQIFIDLKEKKIDVVFLDIEMGKSNGLDIAEEILSTNPSMYIVFVTAHSEYAVQAFEVNSIDYLLKPISTKRLEKTIDRLISIVDSSQRNSIRLPETPPLIINCFNELQVYQSQQLIHFKTAKVKELFAFLLTHYNQYIHKDIIIDKLWPDQDYKKSKIHLHTSLSHLRKKLGSLGYPNCISFFNNCYSLQAKPIHCDAIHFDKKIENVQVVDHTNQDIAIELIESYTGHYLELNHYEWAREKSAYYYEKIMYLLDKVISFYDIKEPYKALYYLQRQLKLNPYLEKSVKKSMQIFIHMGYRSEAVKLYQEFEKLLMEDIGIMPDRHLIQLYQSVLKS